jgi:cellulose 1,4-beta-cellobiosidase
MLTLAFFSLLGAASAQLVGTEKSETHPKLSWQKCTSSGCSNTNGEVVIDANWRWVHTTPGYTNCYDGNKWTSACSGESDCTSRCALEGADYEPTYGVTTSGNQLNLQLTKQNANGKNIGSRLYLMESTSKYQMFNLLGNELAFDVDLSTVECGINSALYFVAMDADGGMSKHPTNKAGAKYGTGYCDAQCARDLKFVGGKANVDGWEPSSNDPNAGVGKYGGCCAEIDVWESNAHSFAFTPHPCTDNAYHVCTDGVAPGCGGTYSDDRFAGKCDANGCDYNPYRMGNTEFYGKGKTVDTTKKFTVVSQFQQNKLTQFLVQNGKKFVIPGPTDTTIANSSDITPEYCVNEYAAFDERSRFEEVGGFPALNKALALPMVLVMSIWNDHYSNMLWLDSIYPPEKKGQPGAARGSCSEDSGVPSEVESQYPNAKVAWSNIRFGPIGSTVKV